MILRYEDPRFAYAMIEARPAFFFFIYLSKILICHACYRWSVSNVKNWTRNQIGIELN